MPIEVMKIIPNTDVFLDQKQINLLKFLLHKQLNCKRVPSVREITEAIHLSSTDTTQKCIEGLINLGFLEKEKRKGRTVHVNQEKMILIVSHSNHPQP